MAKWLWFEVGPSGNGTEWVVFCIKMGPWRVVESVHPTKAAAEAEAERRNVEEEVEHG